MRKLASITIPCVLLWCFVSTVEAQQPSPEAQQAPVTTLQATTRLVLEDVLVTDGRGNAVTGLPKSAFHVSDDGKPQTIRNFEESGTGPAKPEQAAPAGTYSNAEMTSGHAGINAMMIDPIGLEVPDQMYLRLQMLRFLDSMPAGTELAVFRTSAHGPPLLVQSLTQDRALLRKAIDNSIPSISTPVSSPFSKAILELSSISIYLAPLPGRKSLFWFAGRFPLYEAPNGDEHQVQFSQEDEARRATYRTLERARVAVFPIDVRGVVNINISLATRADSKASGGTGGGSDLSNTNGPIVAQRAALPGDDAEQNSSWAAMDEIAAATGGHAYYSNNALAKVMAAAVELGRHSYAVTYTPQSYTANGALHKVKLTVDGPYTVSYRTSYFADSAAGAARTELAAKSEEGSADQDAHPAPPAPPIVFLAKLRSADNEKKASHFVIQYSIAAKDLSFTKSGDGMEQAQFKVAALAYNGDGDVLSNAVDTVTTHYDAGQMTTASRVGVPMQQQMAVAHGAKYLLLSVVDLASGRTGTVQLTVATARANGQ